MFYLLEPPYCTPFPVPYVPTIVPFFPTWVDPKTGKGTWNKVPWSPSPPRPHPPHVPSPSHPILSYPNPYEKRTPILIPCFRNTHQAASGPIQARIRYF
ncbi:hypothetical protein CGRA01v4_06202 [Colletotrichum graminicola]|nr:hypothetical protein CGRA01v4_06202 [Colletotrichum graminicola]